ncbi:hypothetical protein G7Y31_11350 [Corynebacterium lizhenjunii]|uniref:Uncharacterized protein n=1 Tax=Corynebacterium lizhenjunii TaxID=2709394 RepID=A0A7T0KFK6_9CORY|nr:hypothetical protein [Corynebacterium lizhenjunii]QPK79069.1 hypothetical protein G7Y31_11350 [Corynebacterium lizhenjunii]
MIITIVGIVSITLGFFCVLGAYWAYQRTTTDANRRLPIILGLLGLLFLTIIPATSAVFFAATHGQG